MQLLVFDFAAEQHHVQTQLEGHPSGFAGPGARVTVIYLKPPLEVHSATFKLKLLGLCRSLRQGTGQSSDWSRRAPLTALHPEIKYKKLHSWYKLY
eukprot:422462-Rhodomonas_salina.3